MNRTMILPPRFLALRPSGDTTRDLSLGDVRPLAVDANGRPARLVMVRATHQMTGLSRAMPGFNAIRDALSQINWNDSPGAGGASGLAPAIPTRWLGPAPRVVRRGDGASAIQETDIAWPLLLEPAASATDTMVAAAQQNRRALIERALAQLSGSASNPAGGWSGVSIITYTDALNGPQTWWQSGAAARTRTNDRFPTVTEVDMQENPQGPTAADLQSPDYLTWLRDNGFTPSLGGFSWGLALGGALALGGIVYVASKSSRR
jgi:hypothetical protein